MFNSGVNTGSVIRELSARGSLVVVVTGSCTGFGQAYGRFQRAVSAQVVEHR